MYRFYLGKFPSGQVIYESLCLSKEFYEGWSFLNTHSKAVKITSESQYGPCHSDTWPQKKAV